jgi:hypothetical protein
MPFEPDFHIAGVIEQIINRLVGPSKLSIAQVHPIPAFEFQRTKTARGSSPQCATRIAVQDYGLFIRRKTHKGVWLKPSRTLSDYPELFANRKVRPVELMLKPRSVTVVLPEKQRYHNNSFPRTRSRLAWLTDRLADANVGTRNAER